jgi:hypothetical protein
MPRPKTREHANFTVDMRLMSKLRKLSDKTGVVMSKYVDEGIKYVLTKHNSGRSNKNDEA